MSSYSLSTGVRIYCQTRPRPVLELVSVGRGLMYSPISSSEVNEGRVQGARDAQRCAREDQEEREVSDASAREAQGLMIF